MERLSFDVNLADAGDVNAARRVKSADWYVRESLPRDARVRAVAIQSGPADGASILWPLDLWFLSWYAILAAGIWAIGSIVTGRRVPDEVAERSPASLGVPVAGVAAALVAQEFVLPAGPWSAAGARLVGAIVVISMWGLPLRRPSPTVVSWILALVALDGLLAGWGWRWFVALDSTMGWALEPSEVWFGVLVKSCLAGPMFEELIFTGALFSVLRTHARPSLAGVLTCLALGLWHLGTHTPLELFWLGLRHAPLVWLFHRTDSLTGPVAVHVAHNLGVVLWARAVATASGGY